MGCQRVLKLSKLLWTIGRVREAVLQALARAREAVDDRRRRRNLRVKFNLAADAARLARVEHLPCHFNVICVGQHTI
eukprot:7010537-Prymnesium_polylepis.1